MKINRDSGAGLTTSGDLSLASFTGPASLTTSLINLSVVSDGVYSVETNAISSRLKKFDTNLLSMPVIPAVYQLIYANGAGDDDLSVPSALLTDATAFYFADTGNNRIIKRDINNNAFVSKNVLFGAPSILRNHPTAGWMYVADRVLNDVSILDSSLNPKGNFADAHNAADLIYGSGGSPNLYISDNINNRIVVLDSSGNQLFTFGTTGGGLGQLIEPWGLTIVGNDLYIVEHGGGRIHRFRSGGW